MLFLIQIAAELVDHRSLIVRCQVWIGRQQRRMSKAYGPSPSSVVLRHKTLIDKPKLGCFHGIARLYFYIGPSKQIQIIAKPMVRLPRSHREVQIIVLKNILSLAQKNNSMFQVHQKSFVHSNDSVHIKVLQLEIPACLANDSNISGLLREFQAYVLNHDKDMFPMMKQCSSVQAQTTPSRQCLLSSRTPNLFEIKLLRTFQLEHIETFADNHCGQASQTMIKFLINRR